MLRSSDPSMLSKGAIEIQSGFSRVSSARPKSPKRKLTASKAKQVNRISKVEDAELMVVSDELHDKVNKLRASRKAILKLDNKENINNNSSRPNILD